MYELRKFKFVTMASATLPPYIPYFEYLQIISIKKANVEVIEWSYVIGSDVAWIENRLTIGQTVLYHLNDKKRIEAIASHFTSLGFITIHIDANNKDEMMQSGLKDKRLPYANLYICTSVFNDGISVHEHAENYDVIISKASTLHLGPLENVQVTQRFRDKKPDHFFIMRQTNEFNDDIIFSEKMYKQRYEQLVGRAERQAARMTEEYREEVAWLSQESKQLLNDSQEILEKLFPLKDDSFFIFNENKQIIEVNLRAIGEHVYSYLQRVCYSSRYMMEHWLGQHGFRFGEIIEVGQESELEKDLIKTTKNLSDADREVIRKTIACFESYDDALKASQEQIAMTYNEAASLLPFKEFVEDKKEEPQEEESQEEDQKKKQEKLREEYRVALREKVKESQIKQKAGQILREHISILCMDGTKFKDAFAIAQRELVSSTLTGKALKHLKYKTQLQAIAKGVRNPELEKVLESAFIEEVLQAIIINEPLIEDEVNACFENAFIHSDRARERFTVTPKAPKDGELTEGEIQKAARKQWRIRKEFLNYFFEMERIRKTIDGKRVNVWIPIKTLY